MSSFTIARNAVFNLSSFLVTALVTFLLVPLMLKYLGPVGFGIWAIVRVLINYASLGDLGLTNAITKFVAEKKIEEDRKEILSLLISALLMYIIIVGILWLIFLLLKEILIQTFFTNANSFTDDLNVLLIGSLLVLSINLIFSITTSAFNGMQRMDITNAVMSLFWILNGFLMYFALKAGYGLKGLVYANIIATVIIQSINLILFFKIVVSRISELSFARFSHVGKLFKYGKHIFIGAVANGVHIHYDKLLLSSFLGLIPVSSYEIASRVVQQMRQIPILIFNPLLPAASEMEAQNNRDGIVKNYMNASKYLIVLLIPLFGFVGFFAKPLLNIWLGQNDDLAIITLQIFVLSNFLNLLTAPGYFVTLGIGRPQYSMYVSIIGLVSNLILSYVFLRIFGYFGVVTGTVTALVGSSMIFLVLIHKCLRINWLNYLKYFIKPVLCFIISCLSGFVILLLIQNLYIKTLLGIILSVVVYLFLIWNMNYFKEDDRVFFSQFVKKLRKNFLHSTSIEA